MSDGFASSANNTSGGSSSSAGSMTGGEEVSPEMAATMMPPELTETQKGILWFKLTFGFCYFVIGIFMLARFFYVRNVFEVRARSPYLVTFNGLGLLGSIALFAYNAESVLVGRFPVDPERVFIAAFCMAWGVFASFYSRVLRLVLAYSPRLRRKVPWLMSERLLLCFSILFCLSGGILPWYRSHTINGPGSTMLVAQQNTDDRVVWTWASLAISLFLVPVVWRVDDIFAINRELIAFIVLQLTQAIATKMATKHGSDVMQEWINRENVPFVGGIVVFGLSVIDPLRRLAFNPMAKTYPAFARADARRREAALINLKKNNSSSTTDPGSVGESGSASESDLRASRRRKWNYERIAAVPEMAVAFRAFSFRALCQESVLFLEEVSKYESGDYSACSPDNWGQWPAFGIIVARFIADGSPDEINISYGDKKTILDMSRTDVAKFDALEDRERRKVFGESYVEIRYMLESNLLTRFLETREFVDQEANVPVEPPPAARRRQRRSSSIRDGDEAGDETEDGGGGVGNGHGRDGGNGHSGDGGGGGVGVGGGVGGGGGGNGVGWDEEQQQQQQYQQHQQPQQPQRW